MKRRDLGDQNDLGIGGNMKTLKRGQSTLEWVIGAAIILGTLVVGIMAWNNGLVAKIGQMVQRLTQTS